MSVVGTREEPAARTVDPAEFRALMATIPAGVSVITATGADGRPRGMTCSSVCSVAVDPPTLLVCLREGSPTLAAVLERSTFAVNLLTDRARDVAALFASGAPDRFDRVRWAGGPGVAGPHLVADAHTVADCRIALTTRVGDHVVVFGEVLAVSRTDGGSPRPLLYGMRRYWSLELCSEAEDAATRC